MDNERKSALGLPLRAAAVVLVAALFGGAASAQDAGADSGALQTIDPIALHRLMQDMGMWEAVKYQQSLLSAQGGAAQDVIAIETLVRQAKDREHNFSHEQRVAWLNEAIVRQLRVVEAAKVDDKADFKTRLKYAEARFQLAAMSGLDRVQSPYGLDMIFLRGSEEDRRMIVLLTRNAAPLVVDLLDRLRDQINNCTTLEQITLEKPRLEDLRSKVLPIGMWILLYRGLALPQDHPERAYYLSQAQGAGNECAKKDIDVHRGLLVEGTAAGALGQTERALKLLRQVDGEDYDPDLVGPRVQALFEIPRVLAGGGQYTEAMTAIDEFYKKSVAMIKRGYTPDDLAPLATAIEVEQDVSAVILRSYVYDAAAAKSSDAAKAADYRGQALNVLVEFINKHSGRADVQETLYKVIVRKYAANIKLEDPETLKKANPVVLMALAMGNYQTWNDPKLSEAQRLQLMAGPEKALKELLARKDDPAAVKMRPQALWYLAKIELVKRETLSAARTYFEIASKHPANGLAPGSAFNSVVCYSGLVGEMQEKNQSISPNLRREYVKALEALLEKPEWVQAAQQAAKAAGEDPNSVLTHYYELGVELQRLAEAIGNSAEVLNEKIALRKRAAAAYRRVPPIDLGAYMEAQYWALDMEAENVDASKESTTPPSIKEIGDLVSQAMEYSNKAAAEAAKPTAAAQAKMLREYGSRAAYLAATVKYNHQGIVIQALKELDELPKKWPGTTVIEASKEFRIRKLIENGNIEEARVSLNDFVSQYSDRSGPLIDLLIANIQKTIKQLDQGARGPTTEARLKSYRDGYAKFARMLYETKDNADAQTLLDRKQLYGDALIMAGQFAEALTLFEEISAAQTADREVKEKAISSKFDARHQALVQVGADPEQVYAICRKALDDLSAEFVRSTFVARDLQKVVVSLGKALGKDGSPAQSKPGEAQTKEQLASLCLRGHRKLMDRLAADEKEGIAFDAKTFWGLGRSYEGLKKFDEALKIYQRLTQGFDKARQAEQYWESELANCRCWLEAFRSDRGKIENLNVYVKKLEDADKTFGGKYPGFNAIKADIRQILN
ncbi:MAG: tetratricopeptide repeat protein [Planctomycetaceae bacterium]|nr:hypothetical protein [Planctomycetaceae bacterium]